MKKQIPLVATLLIVLTILIFAGCEGGSENITQPTDDTTVIFASPTATVTPTDVPVSTEEPTSDLVNNSTINPTSTPMATSQPTVATTPTQKPTTKPTATPTQEPTIKPTNTPTPTATPHTHLYGSWIITKDATCTRTGTQERECSCGNKESQIIEIKDHTITIIPAIAVTCTSNGYTEGQECSVCGRTLVSCTLIPKGHIEVVDQAIDSSCTTIGYTEGKHCSRCNKVLVAQKELGYYHDVDNHKCKLCDYTDTLMTSFDVSKNQDGSIYAHIYKTYKANEYALDFQGEGEIKDYYNGNNPPYYSLLSKIKYVNFSNGITRIGDCVLCDYSGEVILKDITFPYTLLEIGEDAFCEVDFTKVPNGLQLPESLINIQESAFENARIGILNIPDSVVSIEDYAFRKATISKISFGSGLKRIGEAIFGRDSKYIKMLTSLKRATYENGYYIGDASNPYWMLVGVANKEVTSLNIHPDTVMIYDAACSGCVFLKDIKIPDSVKIIGYYAFGDCDSLETISFGRGTESLNGHVFSDCLNLKEINLDANIRFIGDCNFMECYNLQTINYNGTVQEWNAIEFGRDWSLLEAEGSWIPSRALVVCQDGTVVIKR